MLRNCCSCSLIRFSTSLYCLTLSPLLLCSMCARGWPESHRWSCGWRAHLRPITTLFEPNQYLQITSQSVLLQQAIAVVAMASVVLCFSNKVLQVDSKSLSRACVMQTWVPVPPCCSMVCPSWRCKKNPKFSGEFGPKSRRKAGNCSSSVTVCEIKSAMCKISMQQRKSLQNACFSLRNAGRNHQQINKQN